MAIALDKAPLLKTEAERDKKKKDIKYMRDKDREMVRGVFHFYECPGAPMSFIFKQYKEDPVERFDFQDGGVYSIPLGVAKHLNKNGWYPVHAFMKDENDKPTMKIGQKVHRFGFQSLEFLDIDENSPQLLTAELTGL